MSTGNPTANVAASDKRNPSAVWDDLLRPQVDNSTDFARKFLAQLRVAKLTFGRRVHCPFLRPFFLSPEDEARVRTVAETIAKVAERVTKAALEDNSLFDQFHLRPEEARLARIPTGPGPASTASRLDAFLLPDSLKFAEYNGESPAGPGYSETLSEIFRELPVMKEFTKSFEIHSYPLSAKLLDALIQTYVEWGGKSKRPQMVITDWRGVPTWSEFEILKARFEKLGVPVLLAQPQDLEFDGKCLSVKGKKIDLVYRRVLINDIVAKPKECEALVKAYEANAVCVANNFRCKIPHVKTFFAVLTDAKNSGLFSAAERGIIQQHIPWTRVLDDVKTEYNGKPIELLKYVRENQKNLVLKPSDEYGGTGVKLGWEMEAKDWEAAMQDALPGGKLAKDHGTWITQERIAVRREKFPFIGKGNKVEFTDMLVDFAPYLFRGKMAGFLTRMSSTGLANVTSGGGQIPSFRVEPKKALAAKGSRSSR
jgi:uncharacterized circularly permuted ATP-grasp superfamily protein